MCSLSFELVHFSLAPFQQIIFKQFFLVYQVNL